MEFKKYRKFLLPAAAVALIVNANINRDSSELSKNYLSENEAKVACKREARSKHLKFKAKGKDFSSSMYFCLKHNPETRHWVLERFTNEFKYYATSSSDQCYKDALKIKNNPSITLDGPVECRVFKHWISHLDFLNKQVRENPKYGNLWTGFVRRTQLIVDYGLKNGFKNDHIVLKFTQKLDPIRYYY